MLTKKPFANFTNGFFVEISTVYTEKLSPQPQVREALGLLK